MSEHKKENKSLIEKIKDFFEENDWDIGLFLLAIVAFVFDTWGFKIMFEQNDMQMHLYDYVYYSIRVFGFDLQTPELNTIIPWQLELGRWLSAFVTIWAVMLTVKHIFIDKWRLYKKGNSHIVIVGAGDKGKTLGLDWIKNLNEEINHVDHKRLVVIIEKDKNNPNIDTLKDEGVVFIFGDAIDAQVLKKAKVEQAKYFITMSDSDATNMEIISTLTSVSQDINTKIQCYIHLINNEFYDFFMAKGFANNEKLDIKIFNINSNAARMLFGDEDHLLGSNVFDNEKAIKDPNNKVKIAIFGFGKLGESILVHALYLGHFYNCVPLEVTVVYDDDKDENKNLLDEFEKQYDILKPEYNGKYWDVNFIDDGKFKDENICDYSQIIIAYEDEFESLSNLMKLLKKYNNEILSKNIDISIYSNSFASTANIIQTDKDDKNYTVFKQVRTFGEINKTCSYNMVINQELDKQAILNNKQYNELHGYDDKNKTAQQEWESLNMFLKDSNRYLMEHNKIKKFIINRFIKASSGDNDYETTKNSISNKYFNFKDMKPINWDNMGVRDTQYDTHLSEEEIVQLAKVEHTRWNAFHILNGWKVMSLDQLEERTKDLNGHDSKDGKQKDKIKKLHSCIVNWEELDKVSTIMEHNYKSDDIETIMRIPSLDKIIKNKKD